VGYQSASLPGHQLAGMQVEDPQYILTAILTHVVISLGLASNFRTQVEYATRTRTNQVGYCASL
jgi:hypothetical protein